MNLTEDYCSFETSKLLKEKGFDWPCHGSYHIEYPKNKIVWSPKPVNDDGQIFMNAPTHQMAMRFLRKIKKSSLIYVMSPNPRMTTSAHAMWLTFTMRTMAAGCQIIL